MTSAGPPEFWSENADAVLESLGTSRQGLSLTEAARRLARCHAQGERPKMKVETLELFFSQFKSPIIVLLMAAALLSFFLQDHVDALVILSIVFISGCLGFSQERGARDALEKMLAIVQTTCIVLRGGFRQEIPGHDVVAGDIVYLSAGAALPGDCFLLESKDLFADEAALTGETYPVEKKAGIVASDAPVSERFNCLFRGTHVVSGSAQAVVAATGDATEFGKVSEHLRLKPPETDFERGIRLFGYFLMEVTLILVLAIFAVNVFLKRPPLESFMFSLALAVGLTPQLLPAIISINLAGGAKRMADARVIVKRLSAIESFGSMNVLCSDKTGTITEGQVKLEKVVAIDGKDSEKIFLYAYLNSSMETGFINPIDEAIRTHHRPDIEGWQKADEVPYDFNRKRLSILVCQNKTNLLITKGALENVLAVCSTAESPDGSMLDIDSVKQSILALLEDYSHDGYRVLGIAFKDMGSQAHITSGSEAAMTFAGMLVFSDPPKSGIADTLAELNKLGISLKIITGDNHLVAAAVGKKVGFPEPRVMAASQMHSLSDAALQAKANDVDIFAEVEPNQKERIIIALKKAGNVVGYIGDGINDASALHAADVGISVNNAVDVAKEAAQLVMLDHDLEVLVGGVREGRITFANTMKYIFMATSANFGNMFSMAGASLFLPFLPLLPKQILLTNLMTDFPEMTIVTDRVDQELVDKPGRWNIDFIRRFMLVFGTLSSVFDVLTFGALIFILHASTEQFRTGWYMESVISASLIVLVVRTRKSFLHSRPSRPLFVSTLFVVALTLAVPFTPLSGLLGFQALPPVFLTWLGIIVALYISAAEIAKHVFYARLKL